MIRVLIVSESEMIRRGLESVVANSPSLSLAGSLAEISDLQTFEAESQPEVAVVALASDSIREAFFQTAALNGDGLPSPAYVALASGAMPDYSFDLARSAIRALLPLDASAEEVLAAIRAVAAGLIAIHPKMAGVLREGSSPRQFSGVEPPTQLTGRETEVLALVAEGLGNKEIAWRLHISEHTVKFHISSIFTKLDVSSRAEAVSLGYRLGLIVV